MRLALEDWLAKELNGQPDLLYFVVEKGSWAWRGAPLRKILCNRPGVLLKNPNPQYGNGLVILIGRESHLYI